MLTKTAIIIISLFVVAGCTVEGMDGPIPFWEASNELRRVGRCTSILDLCKLQAERAEGWAAKTQAYKDCDRMYALAGCGLIGEGDSDE